MNEPYKLYKELLNQKYKKSGDCVDWSIVTSVKNKEIKLFFQGSTEKRDWINNFDFPSKVYKKQESVIRVARGWGNAYKSCNDIVMDALTNQINKYPEFSVLIIGHSYGGAMAILAAEDLYFRTKKKSDVITFGSPKVVKDNATKDYIKSCVSIIQQYANVNDFVPMIPFFFKQVNKIEIDKKVFGGIFNTVKYHLMYGDEKIYKT